MQKIETGFSELLNKQPKTAEEKDADIHELQSAVQTLLQEVRNLDEFVALLRKKQFGTSSEVTPTKEEDLPLGMFPEAELEYKENAPEPFKKDRRGVHKRNELEQWKLVNSNSAEDRIADLEDKTCPRCGSQMVRIGKELVREVFEYVPAKLKLVRYWQVSYTGPACKKNGRTVIVRGAVPKPLLNHSVVSASVVAEVMFQKYAHAMPLNRQEATGKQLGVTFSCTTMANWIIRCGMPCGRNC